MLFVIIFSVIIGFIVAGYLNFGVYNNKFISVLMSANSLFNLFFGAEDITLVLSSPEVTFRTVFYIVFMVIFNFIFMKIFTSIIIIVYMNLRAESNLDMQANAKFML